MILAERIITATEAAEDTPARLATVTPRKEYGAAAAELLTNQNMVMDAAECKTGRV